VLRSVAVFLCLGLVACGRDPGAYAPPRQRTPSGGADPGELANFVRMNDATAEDYIVKDVSPEHSEWRWTFVRHELRLKVKDARKLQLQMELAIPPVTFRVTGPVAVTCYIDGKSLGPILYTEPGRHRYQKPVPEGWVQPDVPVTVAAEVDRRWVSKEDGAQLSFLLNSVGLIQ